MNPQSDDFRRTLDKLRRNIAGVFVGNTAAIDRILCTLLAGAPADPRTSRAWANGARHGSFGQSLDCSFSRIN